ncbi:nucleoside hydrolase [Bifidobacterium avesanii]|uniref:Nucleoside hydrolase n=1 Tax=Bifidobacterium avesanii TaxID=1798157 RepID=A0A7K3TIS1_9BIFI|nr:nucleoside hydrolase [Bifidobacterium avesanii]KAB8291040.1 Inosine-uridine preferring nucleoside hydrolase [Bifidobacterium avesanii]NEG78806.1 nucleoside hydrolase [Bifidobacterium avesanii]
MSTVNPNPDRIRHPWLPDHLITPGQPVPRVIIDNDFAGDPDDLFALIHHLLTPAADIRAIVCSHLPAVNQHDHSGKSALHGMDRVRTLLDVTGLADDYAPLLVPGAECPLTADMPASHPSKAVRTIIEEATRNDTDTPLIYAAGGGLTDLATAWLIDPGIARRMRVVWIGGREYPQCCDPAMRIVAPEYNERIDPVAARIVAGTGFDFWQVPRNVYRRCCISLAELWERLCRLDDAGAWLWRQLNGMRDRGETAGLHASGVYCLGDQPLVTLSALLTPWDPAPAGCSWTDVTFTDYASANPIAAEAAACIPGASTNRGIHVLTGIDAGPTFADLFANYALLARWRHDTGHNAGRSFATDAK